MKKLFQTILLIPCIAFSAIAYSTSGEFSVGLFGNAVGSKGVPSNDVLGFGVTANYELKDNWFVSLDFIRSKADFERPWKAAGLIQDPAVKTIDAKYTSNLFMVHGGKVISSDNSNHDWFWSAGLGVNSIDVDDASGPLQGGGNFNVTTTVSSETMMGIKGGLIHHFSDNWDVTYTLRLDRHIAEWVVKDTLSPASGVVDNYATYGASVGISRKY